MQSHEHHSSSLAFILLALSILMVSVSTHANEHKYVKEKFQQLTLEEKRAFLIKKIEKSTARVESALEKAQKRQAEIEQQPKQASKNQSEFGFTSSY